MFLDFDKDYLPKQLKSAPPKNTSLVNLIKMYQNPNPIVTRVLFPIQNGVTRVAFLNKGANKSGDAMTSVIEKNTQTKIKITHQTSSSSS